MVIVVCGFWYTPHSQAIIFRMTKAIPLLMRIVGVTYRTLSFFISPFLMEYQRHYIFFLMHIYSLCTFLWFIFGVLNGLSVLWASHHLRFEWGQAMIHNWNDFKSSSPTYIHTHDIFCFQFQMPSCATAQKTDTIWLWNVNVYCLCLPVCVFVCGEWRVQQNAPALKINEQPVTGFGGRER